MFRGRWHLLLFNFICDEFNLYFVYLQLKLITLSKDDLNNDSYGKGETGNSVELMTQSLALFFDFGHPVIVSMLRLNILRDLCFSSVLPGKCLKNARTTTLNVPSFDLIICLITKASLSIPRKYDIWWDKRYRRNLNWMISN